MVKLSLVTNKVLCVLLVVFGWVFFQSCSMEHSQEYQVLRIDNVTKLEDVDWSNSKVLEEFISPWQQAPSNTTFRALWDDDNVYFRFDVVEPNIMVFSETDEEQEVVRSERVEIFFRQDADLNPYYCLEMDASGRVFDYEAAHYRQFKPQWRWPEGQLKVIATTTSDGYRVTGRVSLLSLVDLGLLQDDQLQVGLFRGRRTSEQESASDANFHWISWVHPETEEPDFHVASSFGRLILLK